MIEQILPPAASAVEAFEDPPDASLFPEEEAALGRAVAKRRREFTTARSCARGALGQLGFAAGPIPAGERGEPIWPDGVVGSITHCEGYRACAVARKSDLATLGIDAERHQPLPEGLLGDIARPEEMGWLRGFSHGTPAICWDRLLFSAKEAVYKAWFPLAERWLGFEDAVLTVDPANLTFSVRLLVPGPILAGSEVSGFSGRWLVRDELVLSTVAVSAPGPGQGAPAL